MNKLSNFEKELIRKNQNNLQNNDYIAFYEDIAKECNGGKFPTSEGDLSWAVVNLIQLLIDVNAPGIFDLETVPDFMFYEVDFKRNNVIFPKLKTIGYYSFARSKFYTFTAPNCEKCRSTAFAAVGIDKKINLPKTCETTYK